MSPHPLVIRAVALIAAALSVASGNANAALLDSFNLVVIGDLDSQSAVEGKTYVGGNLSGSGSNYGVGLPNTFPLSEVSLQVAGNVSAGNISVNAGSVEIGGDFTGSTLNVNSGGNYAVGGNITGNVNNGAQVPLGSIPSPASVAAHYEALSLSYASLAPNSAFAANGDESTFTADPALQAGNLAVFSVDASTIFDAAFSELILNLNSAGAAIINVAGTDVTFPSSLNATGALVTDEVRARVIWNFFEATSVSLESNFNGAVLAPLADLTNTTAIDGSVVAGSFVQRGQVNLPVSVIAPPFGVPEPTALALMTLLGGAATLRRETSGPRSKA